MHSNFVPAPMDFVQNVAHFGFNTMFLLSIGGKANCLTDGCFPRRLLDLSYALYGYIVNRGNGYETRQSSLFYVIALFSGLDPAQNTIVVYY